MVNEVTWPSVKDRRLTSEDHRLVSELGALKKFELEFI